FFLQGMLDVRRHTYDVEDSGRLAATTPLFSSMLVVAATPSIGLPGPSGFVSEILVLLGTFRVRPWIGLLAASGVIFAAFYMLPMVQTLIFNALRRRENRTIPDLNGREITILIPLVVLILWIGIYPRPFLDRMEPSVNRLVQYLDAVSI